MYYIREEVSNETIITNFKLILFTKPFQPESISDGNTNKRLLSEFSFIMFNKFICCQTEYVNKENLNFQLFLHLLHDLALFLKQKLYFELFLHYSLPHHYYLYLRIYYSRSLVFYASHFIVRI